MGRPPKACDEGAKKRGRPKKKEEIIQKTGFDGNPVAPWRKTVSVITQAVTTATTGKKSDSKKGMPEALAKKMALTAPLKPFPVFWAKALEGLTAYSPQNPVHDRIDLKNEKYNQDSLRIIGNTKGVCPVLDEVATAATVVHTLHSPQQPGVFGQPEVIKESQYKKGFAWACDNSQPFISKVSITSDDIAAQEKRVIDARKRLQEAMKHFG